MAAITILNKGNVPVGPFTREQVAAKLNSGEFSLDDLAHVEGLAQWTPLRDVLAKIDGAPTMTPPPYIPPAVPAAMPPAYSYAASMQPPAHFVYAGFWLRVVAYLIDSLILTIPFTAISVIWGIFLVTVLKGTGDLQHFSATSDSTHQISPAVGVAIALSELVFFALILLGTWLYFAMLESGPRQATFGKRALGLQVTDLSGQRIGFGQASGRFFGKIISGMTMYIGYIMAGFTERKQALHDMLAGTLVIRK
jgi:uncharacterized RDD family membrane protein YckC